MNYWIFQDFSMRGSESLVKSKWILPFATLICFSFKNTKNILFAFCHTHSENLWNIFEINALSWKNYFERKFRRHLFVVYVLIYPQSKFGGNRTKFPLSFSSLQCPLQVKKLIQENSTKYVNQTGNFYFRLKCKTAISLPIFTIFQWFLFVRY